MVQGPSCVLSHFNSACDLAGLAGKCPKLRQYSKWQLIQFPSGICIPVHPRSTQCSSTVLLKHRTTNIIEHVWNYQLHFLHGGGHDGFHRAFHDYVQRHVSSLGQAPRIPQQSAKHPRIQSRHNPIESLLGGASVNVPSWNNSSNCRSAWISSWLSFHSSQRTGRVCVPVPYLRGLILFI